MANTTITGTFLLDFGDPHRAFINSLGEYVKYKITVTFFKTEDKKVFNPDDERLILTGVVRYWIYEDGQPDQLYDWKTIDLTADNSTAVNTTTFAFQSLNEDGSMPEGCKGEYDLLTEAIPANSVGIYQLIQNALSASIARGQISDLTKKPTT